MKRLALLSGCLLLLACSDGEGGANTGQGGQAGGNAGSSGGGRGGTTGGGGNTGSGGQTGGTTGSGGQIGGSTGSGGQTGGTAGSAGRGGTTGGGGQAGGTAGSAGRGGTGGGGGQTGGTTGSAGRGGTGAGGGQAGGGRGGSGGAATCAQLASDYNRAMLQAEMCNASLTVVQCTDMVTSMLACGCPIYVNDKTELDRIKAQWDAMACAATIICPAIACPQPVRGACVAIGRGDVCMTQTSPAGGG